MQEEGNRLVEEAQGGWNEGVQTFSDWTSQAESQKWRGYLVWAVVYYPPRHPHSYHWLDSSVAGKRVIEVAVQVDHYSGFVGSPL